MSALIWNDPANAMILTACKKYSVIGGKCADGTLTYNAFYRVGQRFTNLGYRHTADESKADCQTHAEAARHDS